MFREQPLVELPSHRYNRAAWLTPAEERDLTRCLQKLEVDFGRPVSREKTLDRLIKVDELIGAYAEWIKRRLGLSVVKRIPSFSKIIFTDRATLDALGLAKTMDGAHHVNSQTLIVLEHPTEETTMRTLSHEQTHQFSDQRYRVERNPKDRKQVKIKVLSSGYANHVNNSFLYFNEFVTETMNLKFLAEFVPKHQGKSYLDTCEEYGYAPGVLFLRFVIQDLARKIGTTSEDICTRLFRGYVTGDYTVLRMLKRAYGKGILYSLGSITKVNTAFNVWYLQTILSLNDIDNKKAFTNYLEKYEAGQLVELAPGVRVSLPKKSAPRSS